MLTKKLQLLGLQLLGSQVIYQGSAPGPRWRTCIPRPPAMSVANHGDRSTSMLLRNNWTALIILRIFKSRKSKRKQTKLTHNSEYRLNRIILLALKNAKATSWLLLIDLCAVCTEWTKLAGYFASRFFSHTTMDDAVLSGNLQTNDSIESM